MSSRHQPIAALIVMAIMAIMATTAMAATKVIAVDGGKLRGSDSDILTAETAAEMLARKPGTRLVDFLGIGHAPMLMSADQIAVVRDWLLEA